ncbi:MAG TPA: hypothetical protein VKS24_11185 [Bradyrhizobium sp.]|nr:hypothetical protein [Bradyrhizobium sp.]
MAFSGFLVRRNLRNGLAPWCHCAAALRNPELPKPGGSSGKSIEVAALVSCLDVFSSRKTRPAPRIKSNGPRWLETV